MSICRNLSKEKTTELVDFLNFAKQEGLVNLEKPVNDESIRLLCGVWSAKQKEREREVLAKLPRVTLNEKIKFYHTNDREDFMPDPKRPFWTNTSGKYESEGYQTTFTLKVPTKFLVFRGGNIPDEVIEIFGVSTFDELAMNLLQDHPEIFGYVEIGIYDDPKEKDVVFLGERALKRLQRVKPRSIKQ